MMALMRTSKSLELTKFISMLEVMTPEEMEAIPSPRILNTHHLSKYLPRDMVTKKTKTVLCLRNPKDTAASYYHHMTGFKFYDYSGKWENWLGPYVDGKFEYGSYAAYLNDFQDLIEKGPGFPNHVMYYEDLKTNCLGELNRLAKFLEVDLDEKLKHNIVKSCHFDEMSKGKILRGTEADGLLKSHYKFFRKGAIGDWMNWFTVAQNKMFDAKWKRGIRKDTMFNMFKFRYSIDE